MRYFKRIFFTFFYIFFVFYGCSPDSVHLALTSKEFRILEIQSLDQLFWVSFFRISLFNVNISKIHTKFSQIPKTSIRTPGHRVSKANSSVKYRYQIIFAEEENSLIIAIILEFEQFSASRFIFIMFIESYPSIHTHRLMFTHSPIHNHRLIFVIIRRATLSSYHHIIAQ